ncbi:MAG: glycosyltransferase family 4 protein [bacterium]|nr:glycosyltransferase family 4 protein [bacterium]
MEKHGFLKPLAGWLERLEGLAIRNALAVVPVCDALREVAARNEAQRIVVLHDFADEAAAEDGAVEDLRQELGVAGPLLLYVGNLEGYQGIDLLLDSFAIAAEAAADAQLVLIGGSPPDVARYGERARQLGVERRVHLIGPRPLDHLQGYLAQADVLISPRIKGGNTPMKLYSYLESGVPVLATDLDTHTQVVDDSSAMLAAARPEPFAEALGRLIGDPDLRARLGDAGRDLVREHYSEAAYRRKLSELLGWLAARTDLAIDRSRS